jgi:hypothetical protein
MKKKLVVRSLTGSSAFGGFPPRSGRFCGARTTVWLELRTKTHILFEIEKMWVIER